MKKKNLAISLGCIGILLAMCCIGWCYLKRRKTAIRLQQEAQLWTQCQKIRSGTSLQHVYSLLGSPDHVIRGTDGISHLFYFIRSDGIADGDIHIAGCAIVVSNDTVLSSSLITSSTRPGRERVQP